MTEYLWDASHYDWDRHAVSIADAMSAGVAGMTHKITQGTSYLDPKCGAWGQELAAVHLPVAGGYHVLEPGNPSGQAHYYLEMLTAHVPYWRSHPCFVHQIDCEKWGSDRAPDLAEIHAFGDVVVAATHCHASQVLAYAPHWVYGDTLRGLRYPLWASSYGSNPAENYHSAYPGDSSGIWGAYSGRTPLLAQYGSRTIIGHQPNCDANAIRVGSVAAMQQLFVPVQSPPLPGPHQAAPWPWSLPNETDKLGNYSNPSEHVHGGTEQYDPGPQGDKVRAAIVDVHRAIRLVLKTVHLDTYWGLWHDNTDADWLKVREVLKLGTMGVKTMGREEYVYLMHHVGFTV